MVHAFSEIVGDMVSCDVHIPSSKIPPIQVPITVYPEYCVTHIRYQAMG